MSRTNTRWLILGLVVILAAGTVLLSVLLRPTGTVAGAPGVATAATSSGSFGDSTEPSATQPSATQPSSTPPSSSQPSSTDPGSGGSGTNPPPPAGDPDGVVGAETIGDPYYPDSGNAGYDVSSYQVGISFDPEKGDLTANTTVVVTVTESAKVGRFSFDLQPSMKVSSVAVDGDRAAFSQHDAKLVVTPAVGLAPGAEVTVEVSYAGRPTTIAGGTAGLADGGWYTTENGGAIVVGEPFSASAWYPSNEHPSDRALFSVIAQVPVGWKVISNGLPITDLPASPAGWTAFGWSEKSEMATYLSTIYIEKFTQTQDTTSSGLQIINAYGPGAEGDQQTGDKTGQYLDFLATKFGPYPFDSSGGIYLRESLGFALETQTRPVYPGFGGEETVVHELAHQWFGDEVTVNRWADICLNECFASYAEWLWSENGGADLDDRYRQKIASTEKSTTFWSSPLYDMGAGNEFGAVYSRGPLALHALRAEMGDEKFSELLLSWIEENSGGSASWQEFEDLVSKIAGQDETAFLQAWFHSTTVPAADYLWPGDLHK